MKYSVVIPIYNADRTLSKCINSILEQTYTDIELILVNDGSTDDSKQICNFYASKYSNIIFIDKKNEGVAKARNDGLLASTGEYVYFIDPDDWLEKNCFLKANSLLNKSDTDILIFGYKKEFIYKNELYSRTSIFPNTKIAKKNADRNEKITKILDKGLGLPVWNKIFNVDFLRKNKILFPTLKRGQDMAFCCEALNKADNIEIIEDCFYHYQDMHLTKTNKRDPNMYKNHKIIWNRLVNIFYENPNDYVKNTYLVRMFLLWFGYSIPNNIIYNKDLSFINKIKNLRQYLNSLFIKEQLKILKLKHCNSFKLKVLGLIFKSKNVYFIFFIYKIIGKINLTYSNYSKESK